MSQANRRKVTADPQDDREPGESNGTGLNVVGRGVVFLDETTPAYRPAVTRAPNGDLLVAFNTSTDGQPGGEIWMVRSTDDGVTWSEPVTVAAPRLFENGSIHSSRGMATLSDGTILLPFNDGVNYALYNYRDSVLFVARSEDSGHTWESVGEPVELPVETQEHWAGARILELRDGSLLMSLWGTLELVDDWETDPMRWRAASVKSCDGGRTWTDYATIAYDPNTPPDSPRDGILRPHGINEQSLVELPDGRIMAIMRFNASLRQPDPYRTYISFSSDGGLTWSDSVASPLKVETPSLTTAPCTAHLDGEQSKLLFGYRDRSEYASGIAAASVSFDDGATWEGELVFEEPHGVPPGTFVSAEPDFVPLERDRMLAVFQSRVTPAPFGIAFNVLEDEDVEECREHAAQAERRAEETLSVRLERADHDVWPFGLGLAHRTFAASDLVGEVAPVAAQAVACSAESVQLVHGDRPLDPAQTLAEAGVGNGDVVQVRSAGPSTAWWRVGFADLDIYPETRHLYAWDHPGGHRGIALGSQSRSLGLDVRIRADQQVSAVELRDQDGSSRLTGNDYRLLSSSDNERYTDVEGWSFSARDEEGRLVHRLGGLAVTNRYLKIHQRYEDTARTFILANPDEDITVEVEPRPVMCPSLASDSTSSSRSR